MIVDRALSQGRFERDIAPLVRDPTAFARAGLRLVDVTFPVIKVALWWPGQGRDLIVHIQADDYDYLPVQGWWVDEAGTTLQVGSRLVPVGNGFQGNPNTYGLSKTWFCFPGWREYHDHPSHQNLPWPSIRHNRQYRILGLLTQLRADLNRPGVQAQ